MKACVTYGKRWGSAQERWFETVEEAVVFGAEWQKEDPENVASMTFEGRDTELDEAYDRVREAEEALELAQVRHERYRSFETYMAVDHATKMAAAARFNERQLSRRRTK